MSSTSKIALSAVILAAGYGKRMRSTLPKVLFPLLGRPLLSYPLDLCEQLGCGHIAVVVGTGADEVKAAFAERRVVWALQEPPRGTGDAAAIGLSALPANGDDDLVVVLNGDLPLLTRSTVEAMLTAHREGGADLSILTLHMDNPHGYGRIVRDDQGSVVAVVEEADASADQRSIREVNGGIYIARRALLEESLEKVAAREPDNAQGEIYLPPVIEPIAAGGGSVLAFELEPGRVEELQQVNDRAELARATAIGRRRICERWMREGVTIVDPESTHIEEDVVIGQDSTIHPFTVIQAGVEIGKNCNVGPFAHLRVGTAMAEGSVIGNFVEVKQTRLGPRSKAKHLTYLGNGEVGADVNIGAGTIFANYDGSKKHLTRIEDGAFLGSGTILVAPAHMGRDSRTGAGAVVPGGKSVPAGETVVGVPARLHSQRRRNEDDSSAGGRSKGR